MEYIQVKSLHDASGKFSSGFVVYCVAFTNYFILETIYCSHVTHCSQIHFDNCNIFQALQKGIRRIRDNVALLLCTLCDFEAAVRHLCVNVIR